MHKLAKTIITVSILMHAAQITLSTHFTNSGTYKATINNSRTKFLRTEKKIKREERL